MEYVSPVILLNEVLAVVALLAGTVVVWIVRMGLLTEKNAKGWPINPFVNPFIYPAILFSMVGICNALDGDMRLADENQQAQLSANGVTISARVVSAAEIPIGRNFNSRLKWANITFDFTDNQGKNVRATTAEEYNTVYCKVAPWKPGQIWAPGATVQLTYLRDNPQIIRIADFVRTSKPWPSSAWEMFLSLAMIWYFPIAWLGLLTFFIIKGVLKRKNSAPAETA